MMPAFNLTKDLYVESKIDRPLLNRVTDCAQQESLFQSELCALVELLKAENARQQIDSLKKILQSLSKKPYNSQTHEGSGSDWQLALQFLVHIFFISTSKSPVRRVLISYFQGLSSTEQEDALKSAIKCSLIKILTQTIGGEGGDSIRPPVCRGSGDSCEPIKINEDSNQPIREGDGSNQPISLEDCHRLRHDVDTLSALLENFPLGEECLKSVCVEALAYLGQLLKQFYYTYSVKLSPVQQNEIMHNCLETVKLANRICQRSAVAMETKVKDTDGISDIQRVSKQLMEIDVYILRADAFLLDCRTTSAMNIALWLKFLFAKEDHLMVKYLLQTIFKGSHDANSCFEWKEELIQSQSGKTTIIDSSYLPQLSQLEKCLLSDSSYLCLCYGFLAMLSMESMLIKFDGQRCLLLDVLLPVFLTLNKRCKDVGTKLLTAKSVCLLTQKLSQYVKINRGDCDPELLSRLQGESIEIRQILDYIWTSWEDSVDAVRFTVKDTFEHVVAIHLNSLKTGKLPKDDEFLQNLTKSIIHEVSWSCKGKYGTLAVLVGHLGSTRMLELHSGIAVDVLEQLKEQTLACYASDLYEKLFSIHIIELSLLNSDWLDSWQPCWIDPVLKVLCGNNKTQRKHIVEYVLPKLLKTGSTTLQHIVSKLSSGSLIEGLYPSVRGHQLGAMIICLRRARALGQLQGLSNREEKRRAKERKLDSKKGFTEKLGKESATEKIQLEKAATNATDQSKIRSSINQSDKIDNSQSNCADGNTNLSDLWYGVVEVDVLRQALSSRDDQVRLDAFALLCENQKTTELISDLELDLVKGFIPNNLNNQMPSFRQHFLSHLKKLLSRMKESFAVLKRVVISTNGSEALSHMTRYRDFLNWLKHCLLSGLFPGATFARRTTCLGGLVTLMTAYGSSRNSGPNQEDYTFCDTIEDCDIQKLLHCLTDTFEDNKREAAEILIACSKHGPSKMVIDDSETRNLFGMAVTLSCSSRPQDSTTAAYLLKVLLHQPTILQTMKEHGTSLHRKLNQNQNQSYVHNEAGRNENEAGPQAQVLELQALNLNDNTGIQKKSISIFRTADLDIEDNNAGRRLLLLMILLDSLKEQVDVARDNLIVAAANCPLYPTMQCMRYCLADIKFSTLPREQHSMWKQFLSQFTSLCLEISEIVSPVVHNSSPEGNIPVDALKASGLQIPDSRSDIDQSLDSTIPKTDQSNPKINSQQITKQSDATKHPISDQSEDMINKSHETVMLMPEYLVVCCWRSVKEISLILGQLTKDVPVETNDGDDCRGLLTQRQILDIGSYFTVQLLESKHRGAFELAYAGFVKVTEMLWRSSISDLHRLPRDWLKEVMQEIKSGVPESKLCATRRSAGVPFYVQALVTSEPTSTGRLCFKETMTELLALASCENLDTVENSTSKVHALNILRAMYKDTRLGDDVAPYIADGLKVAVLGFKSPLWAVRNSATLLMSAMMVRIFGVKRSKDETYLSRKNCLTGRTFFHRYPSLYQFLLDQLAESTVAMETGGNFQLHPALYPVLMVLGHLFPSAMEGTDTALNLMAFIPYVMKCSHSPVLKTRIMAARALQPLVDKDHVTAVFNDLLTLLPSNTSQGWSQNHIHGILLQIKQLQQIIPTLPITLQQDICSRIVIKWRNICDILLSSDNPCLLIRKETLEITSDLCGLVSNCKVEEGNLRHVINDIRGHVTKLLLFEIMQTDGRYWGNSPGLTEYEGVICKLSLKCLLHLQNIELSKKSVECKTESDECKTELNMPISNNHSSGCLFEVVVAEKVILKFLKSSSYETQKCCLEIIKDCFQQKQASTLQRDTEDFYSSSQVDNLLTSNEVDYLYDVVQSSTGIYEELVSMVTEKELYHECLTEVFEVLQFHPISRGQGHVCKYSTEELLEKMIEKEKCQKRDEVITALIGYSGLLTERLSRDIMIMKNKATTTATDNQIQKKLDLIEQWACMIQRHCGTEQNSDKQLACVKAIAQNAEFLLCKDVLGSLTFYFWKIVLDLLQEDDLEVKDTAAGILSLCDESLKAPVHPSLALDLLIGQLLSYHSNKKMEECICFLIGLIAEDTDGSEEFEERLFDRGEMNTYREPVDFIDKVDKHLLNLLKGELLGKTTAIKTRGAILDQEGRLTAVGNDQFVVTVQKILQAVESLVSDLSLVDGKAVFLNTSFNRSFLNTYRALTLLKYGFILSTSEITRKHFVNLWEKIQVTLLADMPVRLLTKSLVANIEHFIEL